MNIKSGNIRANPLDFRASNEKKIGQETTPPPTPNETRPVRLCRPMYVFVLMMGSEDAPCAFLCHWIYRFVHGGGGGYNDTKKCSNKKYYEMGLLIPKLSYSPWEGFLERPHHFKPEIIVRKADNWQVEFLITYLC